MKEQIYQIKNFKDFDCKHIFECGQCFRWNLQPDNSYTGVFKNNVLNVKQENSTITFKGICNGPIEQVVKDYFDLDTDYSDVKKQLSQIDNNLKLSIEYGEGIRLLNQDVWESIISFIISANNNIPRIKKIIERISKQYGNKIEWNGHEYFTFPTIEQLSHASVQDLRNLGLGFRDKRVYDTTQMFVKNEISIKELEEMKDTNSLREKLLTLPGVGEKVADCILLFSLKRWEVFPIDVWVRRVMNELYIKKEDETKVSKIEIQKLAKEKYDNLAGIAQQYLFYWKREA